MKILYIDVTTSDLAVAIVEENSIKDFSLSDCGVRHSETLCNRVAEMLSFCGLRFVDFDAYACAIGPGSFTGIRIGVSTVKGYNLAVPKPLISVNCLQATAFSQNCGFRKCAVIDAGNGYYYADFQNDVLPCIVPYDDPRALSAGKSDGAIARLDGAAYILRDKFNNKLFDEELVPLYIRRSQAEENLK